MARPTTKSTLAAAKAAATVAEDEANRAASDEDDDEEENGTDDEADLRKAEAEAKKSSAALAEAINPTKKKKKSSTKQPAKKADKPDPSDSEDSDDSSVASSVLSDPDAIEMCDMLETLGLSKEAATFMVKNGMEFEKLYRQTDKDIDGYVYVCRKDRKKCNLEAVKNLKLACYGCRAMRRISRGIHPIEIDEDWCLMCVCNLASGGRESYPQMIYQDLGQCSLAS